MKKLSIANLLFNLVVCMLLVAIATPVVGSTPAVCIGVGTFSLGFIPRPEMAGVLHNEVIRTVFSRDLQEKLFPDNSFYSGAFVDEGVEIDAETVEIPQDENGDAQYVVNPSQFPLEVYSEQDSKKTYNVDLIATKPELVTDLNQALVSYDKRSAKLRKHLNTLQTQIADRIAYGWAPSVAAHIRQTTGTDLRVAQAPGATGNRKKAIEADVLAMFTLFNRLNIPMEGRRVLVTPGFYEDFMTILKTSKAGIDGVSPIVEAGAIGKLFSFNIYLRSQSVIYTEAATPVKKAPGAASATTDNECAIFYHPRFVRYAKGNVKTYINAGQGQYLGDTMNAALRGGGTSCRISQVGVAALVEDNG